MMRQDSFQSDISEITILIYEEINWFKRLCAFLAKFKCC